MREYILWIYLVAVNVIALIMCAVILAVGEGQPKFVAVGCVNIVVGANAGGAFSPFGDILSSNDVILRADHGPISMFKGYDIFLTSSVVVK